MCHSPASFKHANNEHSRARESKQLSTCHFHTVLWPQRRLSKSYFHVYGMPGLDGAGQGGFAFSLQCQLSKGDLDTAELQTCCGRSSWEAGEVTWQMLFMLAVGPVVIFDCFNSDRDTF